MRRSTPGTSAQAGPFETLTKSQRGKNLGLLLSFGTSLLLGLALPTDAAPCTCRYKGNDYSVGDVICLKGPDGPQMAQCGYVLNNTSWNMTKAPCPTASNTLQNQTKIPKVPALPTKAS